MSREEKLTEFVGWAQHYITGDEKGQAQIFLDRLFQTFGHPGVLDAVALAESCGIVMRIIGKLVLKSHEDTRYSPKWPVRRLCLLHAGQ